MVTRISPVHVRDAEFEAGRDGSLLVRNPEPLRSYPERMTERLERWAARTPDRPFLVARSGKDWRKVSYAEAIAAARASGGRSGAFNSADAWAFGAAAPPRARRTEGFSARLAA